MVVKLGVMDRLTGFDNKKLRRRIFGPKKKEVLKGWTKSYDDKLRTLDASPIIAT
jgi:hypothetical protein